MRRLFPLLWVLVCLWLLASCSHPSGNGDRSAATLITLDNTLAPLVSDFNEHKDALKLVFIVGPT